MKYIRACRVSYGKQLLQNGATVEEAAEKCGYSSAASFYNATTAEFNISPSKLRK
jgi:AraC-like DNA-binding protein